MAATIGEYQILGELGKGAHSTIYHVRRLSDQRQFALKIVPIQSKDDSKFHDQAQHEFRVGRMLDHVNLIKVYTLEAERDWLFRVRTLHLLIEYVNGKTLDQWPRLTMPRLVQAFAKIAAGLVHMHRRGVYHADLKPSNVLLSKAGEIKIIDFGLAWIKGEPKERVQGTPEYMAPEQSKHRRVNELSDIYNLGATMYRMTTWQPPPSTVGEEGAAAMTSKDFVHLLKPVQQLAPKAPKMLCELIHQCLAYQAKDRPQRVSDVLGVLNLLIEKLVQTDDDKLEALGW